MSYDQTIYDQAVSAGDSNDDSDVIQKKVSYIIDSNQGNYSSNQVIFETQAISNSQEWNNLRDAFIVLPLVMSMSGTDDGVANPVDFTSNHIKNTDFALMLKNRDALLHSVSVDYDGMTIVQACPNQNLYTAFLEATTGTREEDKIKGSFSHSYDDSRDSWRFDATASQYGKGISNNCVQPSETRNSACYLESSVNSGAYERQKGAFIHLGRTRGQSLVLGDDSNIEALYKNLGVNYIQNLADGKHWYYNYVLPLSSLPFFSSPDFPSLMKGAFMRIVLTINQTFFQVSKSADGFLDYTPTSTILTTQGCEPLMFSASYLTERYGNGTALNVITSADVIKPSGSACLPISKVYKCSLSIVKTQFPHVTTPAVQCQMNACRLYYSRYTLNPTADSKYLSLGQKRIKYDVVTSIASYVNQSPQQSFDLTLSSGVSNGKMLVIVPMLSASGNAGFSQLQSPFDSAPNTTAPIVLSNFQIYLGNKAIYENPVSYGFEHFSNELSRVMEYGNSIHGECRGKIGFKEFMAGISNYIVCDMKRRLPEDSKSLISVRISGKIESLKAVDLYCFLVEQRELVIDLSTGQRIK